MPHFSAQAFLFFSFSLLSFNAIFVNTSSSSSSNILRRNINNDTCAQVLPPDPEGSPQYTLPNYFRVSFVTASNRPPPTYPSFVFVTLTEIYFYLFLQYKTISETDSTGRVVSKIDFPTNFNFECERVTNNNTNSKGENVISDGIAMRQTLKNGALVELLFSIFRTETHVYINHVNNTYEPPSVRFVANLTNWPLRDPSNRLQIDLRIKTSASGLDLTVFYLNGNIQKVRIPTPLGKSLLVELAGSLFVYGPDGGKEEGTVSTDFNVVHAFAPAEGDLLLTFPYPNGSLWVSHETVISLVSLPGTPWFIIVGSIVIGVVVLVLLGCAVLVVYKCNPSLRLGGTKYDNLEQNNVPIAEQLLSGNLRLVNVR